MNNKTEGLLAILAAFLVLFSAMFNPITAAVIAITMLVALGAYKLLRSR